MKERESISISTTNQPLSVLLPVSHEFLLWFSNASYSSNLSVWKFVGLLAASGEDQDIRKETNCILKNKFAVLEEETTLSENGILGTNNTWTFDSDSDTWTHSDIDNDSASDLNSWVSPIYECIIHIMIIILLLI